MREVNEIFGDVANSPPVNDYGDRIKTGNHLLALKNYQVKKTENTGKIISADFVVIESDVHARGSVVGTAWFISDPTGWKKEKALGRAREFVESVMKCFSPDTVPDVKMVQQWGTDLIQKHCPGRGIILRAVGGEPQGDSDWVEVSWYPIDQIAEQIRDVREQIENGLIAPNGAQAAAAVETTPEPVAPPVEAEPKKGFGLTALLGK